MTNEGYSIIYAEDCRFRGSTAKELFRRLSQNCMYFPDRISSLQSASDALSSRISAQVNRGANVQRTAVTGTNRGYAGCFYFNMAGTALYMRSLHGVIMSDFESETISNDGYGIFNCPQTGNYLNIHKGVIV
jgi:hypothetical protein